MNPYRIIRRARTWIVHRFFGGESLIAFDFGDPETERLFWESVESAEDL